MYSFCFKSQVDSQYDRSQNVIIREGSIVPLYSYNLRDIVSGIENFTKSDDIKNLSLDLHMFNDNQFNGTSKGELLMDDGLGTIENADRWCYIEFEMIRDNATLVFRDLSLQLGRSNASNYNCGEMRSYQLRTVTIYGSTFTDGSGKEMSKGIVTMKSGANTTMVMVQTADPSEGVRVLQVSGGASQSLNYFDISTIQFLS